VFEPLEDEVEAITEGRGACTWIDLLSPPFSHGFAIAMCRRRRCGSRMETQRQGTWVDGMGDRLSPPPSPTNRHGPWATRRESLTLEGLAKASEGLSFPLFPTRTTTTCMRITGNDFRGGAHGGGGPQMEGPHRLRREGGRESGMWAATEEKEKKVKRETRFPSLLLHLHHASCVLWLVGRWGRRRS
jgi:hypothetical protein